MFSFSLLTLGALIASKIVNMANITNRQAGTEALRLSGSTAGDWVGPLLMAIGDWRRTRLILQMAP